MIKNKITVNSVVQLVKSQISCNWANEVVILGLKDSVYYGLNPVGAVIWDLIKEPKRVNEIVNVLFKEYCVEKQQCEDDILHLLEELKSEELIEVIE